MQRKAGVVAALIRCKAGAKVGMALLHGISPPWTVLGDRSPRDSLCAIPTPGFKAWMQHSDCSTAAPAVTVSLNITLSSMLASCPLCPLYPAHSLLLPYCHTAILPYCPSRYSTRPPPSPHLCAVPERVCRLDVALHLQQHVRRLHRPDLQHKTRPHTSAHHNPSPACIISLMSCVHITHTPHIPHMLMRISSSSARSARWVTPA